MKRTSELPTFEPRRHVKAKAGAYRFKAQTHHAKKCRKRGGVRGES